MTRIYYIYIYIYIYINFTVKLPSKPVNKKTPLKLNQREVSVLGLILVVGIGAIMALTKYSGAFDFSNSIATNPWVTTSQGFVRNSSGITRIANVVIKPVSGTGAANSWTIQTAGTWDVKDSALIATPQNGKSFLSQQFLRPTSDGLQYGNSVTATLAPLKNTSYRQFRGGFGSLVRL